MYEEYEDFFEVSSMRIQNNIQKINFHGYKNLLYEDIRGENCSVSFFATQLDNQGEKAKRYNEESERFRNKWKAQLEAGDPYYNPNFSLDRSDFSLKIKSQK